MSLSKRSLPSFFARSLRTSGEVPKNLLTLCPILLVFAFPNRPLPQKRPPEAKHFLSSQDMKEYGYVESEPKTVRSRRTIKLSAFAIAVLLQHRERQQEQEENADEMWIAKGLVFTNTTGDFYSPSTMLKVFT